jgi:ferrochelatase
MDMTSKEKIAVVLFQLGGPDSLEAVEPFLYNLFCDPDIINFPGAFLARKALAKFIASRRGPIAAGHYKEIGGKSPIRELTQAQANALERELNKQFPAEVFVAMRYWHPLSEEVLASLQKGNYSKIILIPLYPQFSKATTISSFKEWNRLCKLLGYTDIASASVCCYYNHPLYIEAIVDNINSVYTKFSHLNPQDIDLVFSAHGIPVSLLREGDPYQRHIEETVRLVCEQGKWASPHLLCYQSKIGPSEWLKPSLNTTLEALAQKGRKHLLIIPVAFVTEHIETLHEINMEAREEAEHLGIVQFEMMPALNDSPKFIQCLVDLVMKKVHGTSLDLMNCRELCRTDPGSTLPVLCPHWRHESR